MLAGLRASPRLVIAIRAALIAIAAIGLTAVLQANGLRHDSTYGDPWNYLAAGERLNAGHPLYALAPGDRPVVLIPPYWDVPLLSPPSIAIVWRPLAILGDASMTIWMVATVLAIAAAILWLCRSLDLVPLLAVAIVSPALGMLAWSGNVNGLVLLGIVVLYARRDSPAVAGILLAALVATKLTPIYLAVWLISTKRWSALGWMTGGLAALAVATAITAGVDSFSQWLTATAAAAPSPLSLAHLLGVPPLVVGAALGVVVVAAAAIRPGRGTFAVATAAAALATPALYFQALALLCAAAAPWTTGRRDGAERRRLREARLLPGTP